MTNTLNLFECLLETARRQARSHQLRLAVRTLCRLSRFPDLSAAQTEQIHSLWGELLLRERRYGSARKHLVIAARLNRTSARYFMLLGLACHHDPRGDRDRAARYYARSLRLAPQHVRCLGEAGLLAVAMGDDDRGLELLRRAAEIEPDNASAIVRLCRGLCRTGQPEEALRTIRLAQFRLPRSAALCRLSAELLLDRLRSKQEGDAATQADGEPGPVVLPFLQVVGPAGKRYRYDAPATTQHPHLFRMRKRQSRRKAP